MAVLTLADFMKKIRDNLKTDTEFNNYCLAKFGKKANIYLGHNELVEPDPSEYPIVVIMYANREQGENNYKYICELGFAISNESISDSGNTKTYDGVLEVEDFRDAGELAIFRTFKKLASVGETMPSNVFPVFRSNSVISVEIHRNKRSPIGG